MEEALRTTMNFAPKKYYIFGKLRNLKKNYFAPSLACYHDPLKISLQFCLTTCIGIV